MKKLKKLNGFAKWIAIAIAAGSIFYNTIVTHVVLKNDVKHLQNNVTELKQDVKSITNYLLTK